MNPKSIKIFNSKNADNSRQDARKLKQHQQPETIDLKTPHSLLVHRPDRDISNDYSTSASVLPSSIPRASRPRSKQQYAKIMTTEPRKPHKNHFDQTPQRSEKFSQASQERITIDQKSKPKASPIPSYKIRKHSPRVPESEETKTFK